jgi:ribosomal protein S18 acetylase RimI-like enzyme
MSIDMKIEEEIIVENAPDILGLIFRGFRGEEDYPHMADVINTMKVADQIEWSLTAEDIARDYTHLVRCDPEKDMLFAEVDGEVVAYSRCMWDEELNGDYLYSHFVNLKPAWRGMGIGRAMSDHQQERLREIASEHPAESPKFFQAWASETQTWQGEHLIKDGFEPVRYGLTMTRPCNKPLEALPLPEGLEIRPVRKEHYRQIWEADQEAFQDHWGYVPATEENYKEWLDHRYFQPHLWKVAWDGNEVVGMVGNFIAEDENEEYKRKRGYTEDIFVRRPWRKSGVARALLTQSVVMFQEMGMEETCLGVDTQNPNGAKRLYESVGYKEIKRHTTYRKEMD